AALSMAAAGLNPQVLSPSVSTVQAAIREQPQVNSLVLLATLAGAALLFAGGVLGEQERRAGQRREQDKGIDLRLLPDRCLDRADRRRQHLRVEAGRGHRQGR